MIMKAMIVIINPWGLTMRCSEMRIFADKVPSSPSLHVASLHVASTRVVVVLTWVTTVAGDTLSELLNMIR